MNVTSNTSTLHDETYQSRLAELSQQFWDGYGDNPPEIIHQDKRIEWGRMVAPPDDSPSNERIEWGRMVAPPDPLEINGVRMSQVAMDQLRLQGLPLHWYTQDELEDAVMACQKDATLIDDPDGDTLEDKLYLEENEKPHAKNLPVLHGFHRDEYDRIITGIRMLSDPIDIDEDDHICNGLGGGKYRVCEHDTVQHT